MTTPELEMQRQLPDYALGLLSAEQARALEAQLPAHPAWQRELRALQDGLTDMVLSLPPQPLPDGAGERLLARLNAEESGNPQVGAVPTRPVTASPVTASPVIASPVTGSSVTASSAPARPEPLRPTRTGVPARRWLLPAALLAAAAVVGVLTLPALLRGPADALARYSAEPGAVPGTVSAKNGQLLARVVRLPDGSAYVQMVSAAPAGRIYQAWQVVGSTPRSLGTFNGRGFLARGLPPQGVFAVSVEPPGGSAQPTSPPLFAQAL